MGDRDPKPANVPDVAYHTAAGVRPIGEVLRERQVQARQRPAAERELAFRIRAGLAAELGGCLCSFPLLIDETTASGHEEWCPGHGHYESARRVELEYPVQHPGGFTRFSVRSVRTGGTKP